MCWVGVAVGDETGREQRLERQADLSSGGTEMFYLGGPPASLPDACLPPPVCLGALVVSLVPGAGHHPSLSKFPARPPRPRRKGDPTHALLPV